MGLAISRMTDPKRVIAFLEWGPNWSESLLFVMGGALSISLLGTWWALQRPRPVLDSEFHLPKKAHIDRTLLSGAILFGNRLGTQWILPGSARHWSCKPPQYPLDHFYRIPLRPLARAQITTLEKDRME